MSEAAHLWPVRVYYEDTDAAGIVYYANYLRFLERGRTEFLRFLGFEQSDIAGRLGLRFAVAAIEARFLAPARLDDRLLVATELTALGRASCSFAQSVLREDDERALVEARVRIACLDAQGRPARWPAELERALADHLWGRNA